MRHPNEDVEEPIIQSANRRASSEIYFCISTQLQSVCRRSRVLRWKISVDNSSKHFKRYSFFSSISRPRRMLNRLPRCITEMPRQQSQFDEPWRPIDNWTVNMSTDTTASNEGVSPAQLEFVSLLILLGAEFIIALTFSLPWSVSPPAPIAHLFIFRPSILTEATGIC